MARWCPRLRFNSRTEIPSIAVKPKGCGGTNRVDDPSSIIITRARIAGCSWHSLSIRPHTFIAVSQSSKTGITITICMSEIVQHERETCNFNAVTARPETNRESHSPLDRTHPVRWRTKTRLHCYRVANYSADGKR